MIVTKMTTDMFFGCNEGINVSGRKIPAYLSIDRSLIIGENGSSRACCSVDRPEDYSADEFVFFCVHKYHKGNDSGNPFYLYKGIPFELRTALKSKTELCTYLAPCSINTRFCKCNNCGENFVIDDYEAEFYENKNLTLPTARCKPCRNSRKFIR